MLHLEKLSLCERPPAGGPEASLMSTYELLDSKMQFADMFSLSDELGSGFFGSVRSCIERATGQMFACKSIQKHHLTAPNDRREIDHEVAVMERLGEHPNVVKLQGVYEDAERVHVVMELCRGGELFDEIVRRKHYGESEAAGVFRDIVEGVAHCHGCGVLHGDLKPENILLASRPAPGAPHPRVKLADFGLATLLRPGELPPSRRAGSPYYMAPEVVDEAGHGFEADMWSLGVVLYILLSGELPFWGQSHDAIFAAVHSDCPSFREEVWQGVSLEAKGLVWWLLAKDPRRRPSAPELLAHPWLARAASQKGYKRSFSYPSLSSASAAQSQSPQHRSPVAAPGARAMASSLLGGSSHPGLASPSSSPSSCCFQRPCPPPPECRPRPDKKPSPRLRRLCPAAGARVSCSQLEDDSALVHQTSAPSLSPARKAGRAPEMPPAAAATRPGLGASSRSFLLFPVDRDSGAPAPSPSPAAPAYAAPSRVHLPPLFLSLGSSDLDSPSTSESSPASLPGMDHLTVDGARRQLLEGVEFRMSPAPAGGSPAIKISRRASFSSLLQPVPPPKPCGDGGSTLVGRLAAAHGLGGQLDQLSAQGVGQPAFASTARLDCIEAPRQGTL
eukprot:jgi/Mesen1/673/ME000109S10896